jgi:RND superfamily putative drug exporter
MALFGKYAWYLPKWLDRVLPNVDIEGEGLRAHVADSHWATAEREAGHAISLDELVAGDRDAATEPVSLSIPAGAFAYAGGAAAPRRLLAATVAGRLTAVSGRAQVAGHPVPTDAARVTSLVALGDLGGGRGEVGVTIGALLTERIRATGPWYRGIRVRRRSDAWLDRIRGALAAAGRDADAISTGAVISTLSRLDRAVALAAVALSERTPVVLLELADPLADADARAFLIALARLAPATTTVVVGSPQARGFAALAPELSRSTIVVAPTAEGAVR